MACYAAGFLVAVATLLALPLQAQAQTVQTLVSNTGQDRDNSNLNVGGSTGWVQAQGFTTGDNTDGYTLSSVDVFFRVGFGSTDEVTVSIYGADASGDPGSSLYVLNNPSSIPNANQIISFAAPANTTLAHGTNYFVVVEAPAGAFFLAGTDFDDEDSGNASGWSIHDTRSVNSQTATDWSEWEVALLIAVKGTVTGGTTTTPGAPTGLMAAANGSTQIDLSWTAPSDDGGFPITGYRIEVSSDAGSSWTDLEADTGNDGTSYSHTGLSAGTTRHYRVSAINSAGTGAASGTADATTEPTVVTPETEVADGWTLKPSGLSAGTRFRLLFITSTTRNAVPTAIAEYNTFVQNRAAAGHMEIQSHSGGFRAVGSTEDVDARDNTSTTYTSSDKGVPIYWLDGNKVVDDYEDFYDGDWDEETTLKNESGNTFTATGSTRVWTGSNNDGTEYFNIVSHALGKNPVKIGAPSAAGGPLNGNFPSVVNTAQHRLYALSSVFVVAGGTLAEIVPDGVEVTSTAVADDTYRLGETIEITVTFNNAVTVGGTPRIGFVLNGGVDPVLKWAEYSSGSGSTALVFTYVVQSGDKDDDGIWLQANRLELQGGTINAAADNTVAAILTYTQPGTQSDHKVDASTVPGAPTGLTATADGSTQIDLSWTAPADGGSSISGYRIEVSSDGGSSWIDLVADTDETNTTYSHTGLTAGNTRHYRVSAINSAGTGAASGTANATTETAVVTTETEVAADWDLKPSGLSGGNKFRLLFITSTTRNAVPTAIADYNTFVQNRAAAGHTDIQSYSSGFRAVGSTEDVDARDNTSTTYTSSDKGVPIYWLDGNKVVDDYEDFYDGDWDEETTLKNESGNTFTTTGTTRVWTGSNHDGTEVSSFGISNALGRNPARTGRPNSAFTSAAGPLTTTGIEANAANTETRRLYALSSVFVVEDGTTLSTDATLSALTVNDGTTEHTIDLATTPYTVDVGNAVTTVTLTATPTHTGASVSTVTLGGTEIDDDDFTDGITVPSLAEGDNVIVVTVTAEDGSTTETYTVTVTRAGTTTTAPEIVTDGVEVTSTPATGDTYRLGETIEITVTFDNAVTVNTSSGTPRIEFVLNGGESPENKWAEYSSGSGGTALEFTYDVQSGDKDDDGIWLRENKLELQGGTISAAADNTVAAILTYVGPGTQTEHKVDGSTVPGAPTGLTATASGTSTIDLSWDAPADDGGSTITGYRIEVSPNGTSSWTNRVADTGTTTTTYSHTGLSAGTTRHYRVSAINANGTGAASNVDNATTDDAATTVPDAPTSLTATASGTTAIDLSWTAPADDGGSTITGYRIEVSPNGTSSWTDRVADTGTTTTTYSHTGLSAGTTRHYRVSAINANGTGAVSNIDDATTDDAATTVPDAPTSLTATASGTTTIDLSWTAPADNGGSAITGYRIEVSPNGTSSWTDRVADTGTTTTTYSHTGLSAGTTRHYRVSAINANGTGAVSNIDDATTDDAATTVPDAPTSLTATASGTTAINLSWTAPADDGGSAITGYRIEVSPNGTSSWTDRVADTGTTTTTYSHTGLSAGTTRHYRVSAINANGTGAVSNIDDATTDDAATTVPDAPTSLTATASGTTTIDLSWTAPADNGGSAITGYRIEVSPNGTSSWTDRVADTGTTTTTYSHTGLSAGTTRHYRVSAINANGTGAVSNIDDATTDDAATTVPDAPTSLTATASGTTAINLSWTAPADDGGSAITGYRIEVSPNGTSSWTDRVADTGTTTTTYSHTGLSAGTTRHYRVSAINANGTGAVSNIDDATTDDAATTVPDAPTSLTATASGTTTIDLSWTAPADDGGSAITGYRIEVSPNGTSSWTNRVADTGTTTTTYSHTGLSAGTTRHYRVSAINANGTGAVSSTDNATTDDAATTVPGAPTNLMATANGSTQIDLSWNAPTNTGGASIIGYEIEVSSDDGSNWTNRVANTGTTTTSYSHTGLSAGTTRHYRVSAINANGTGAASSTANATTSTTTAPLVLTVEAVEEEVTEGEPVRYRILMSRPTSGAVVASVYKYKGDFVRNPNSRVVGGISGARSWGVAYATLDDAEDEEDGSFTVTIEQPGADQGYGHGEAYTVGTPSSATVTILDNDPEDTPPVPIVSVEDARVKEGPDAELVFPAKLNVAPVKTAKIHWQTLDGANSTGAKAGKDYVGASGTLEFSPGQTVKTIRVEVIDDTEVEGNEVMLLYLSGAENAVIDDALMKGTIEDNDAASDAADAADDALAVAEGLTPDEAADALFGERRLSEARLAALDLLGNRNGRYDLGDLLAWVERCRRGEARCGPTSTGSGPPSAAGLLAAAAAGRPWISRRTRRRGSGCPGRKPIRTARRRGRFAGYALATLLAATMTLSCTEGSVAPAAYVPDPGFLTVEWSGPATHLDVGVLLELEGPTIDAVRAPGFELYESRVSGRHQIVVAGSLRPGPFVQFRVPDRNRFALYRVRVLEVTGEGYGLRDPTEYRAVVIMN